MLRLDGEPPKSVRIHVVAASKTDARIDQTNSPTSN
jgi:hypothetical protein